MGQNIWQSNEETCNYMSKNLTDEELAKLKDIVAESIAQQRSRLLMKHKFIGGVVMHLEMIPVRDNRVRTAMTDGKHVYFDLAFYSELSDDERLFVLAHEAWHCVYMHMLRRKGRDPRIWNFATDMEINRMLENDHFTPPADVLFPDPKWKNGDTMSAEEMYELLLKDMKKAAKNTAKNSGMPMPGNGGSGSDNDTNDSEDDQQDGNGESADEKKYAKNSGKRGGKLKGQFDDHVYNGEDKDKLKSKKTTDKWGEVGEDPDFNPTVDRQTAERIREMVMNAAERCKRTQGTLPGGLESYLEKLREPKISWKEYLSQFVTVCLGDKRQWLPVNRRHVYNGIYLQSRRSERLEGIVAIDTSGSCVDELPKFFGELKGLIDTFGKYEIRLICADAAVEQVDVYNDNDNPLQPNTIEHNIKWSGGGGTDYTAVFEYIDKEGLQPDFLIYMGDGYATMNYKKQPNYPVLWFITPDGTADFCDWGLKVFFDNDDDTE